MFVLLFGDGIDRRRKLRDGIVIPPISADDVEDVMLYAYHMSLKFRRILLLDSWNLFCINKCFELMILIMIN